MHDLPRILKVVFNILAITFALSVLAWVILPKHRADGHSQESATTPLKQEAEASGWKTITADNGAVYKIDMSSIAHFNTGSAEAVFYADEGGVYNPINLRKFLFDCHGHYLDEMNYNAGTKYTPPRSVAGEVQRVACGQ